MSKRNRNADRSTHVETPQTDLGLGEGVKEKETRKTPELRFPGKDEKLPGKESPIEGSQVPERGVTKVLKSQKGKVGYLLAWLLGVPAWILLMIFLIRGH